MKFYTKLNEYRPLTDTHAVRWCDSCFYISSATIVEGSEAVHGADQRFKCSFPVL